ncbi:MAG: beta-ketoacyl synthase N-terminal-like domain-containing protein [Planctomycetaceae bacterium]|nr:hypothetical protein [Planctomycetaceae bacterium]
MAERRVVITGLGPVAPSGIGIEAFWSAALAGRRCVRRVEDFDPSNFPTQICGPLTDFSARDFVPKDYRKAVKVMARDIQIAVACADLAIRDAGLSTPSAPGPGHAPDPARFGCNIGSGLMCADMNELGSALVSSLRDGRFDFHAWGSGQMENLAPLWLLKYLPNMCACHTTILHQCKGPSNTIACGDASGHLAVAEAASWIRRGAADVVVAGATESKLNPMGLLRQTLLGRTCVSRNDDPAGACCPFDAAHSGTVIGEGGGLIILEELKHARARKARIYAEVVGWAAASDPAAVDLRRPTCGNVAAALRRALAKAALAPDQIDLALPHGTAVPAEDDAETAAWSVALTGRAAPLAACTATGALGSLFAGASGISTIAAAMALHTQTIPPTVNFTAPAAPSSLTFQPTAAWTPLRAAACASFTVGGQSAACVLKRYPA